MKLVILDRDGVINFDSDQFIKSPDEWKPIPGSLEAIARLNHSGYHVVVATNQSGVGRGLFDMAMLNAIHDKMYRALSQYGGRIDAVFYCPHTPDDDCACRKPKPGLFLQIGERFGVELKGTPVVGDGLRDLQAGHAAGCEPHLVLTGKGEALQAALQAGQALPPEYPPGTQVHADLATFADFLIARKHAADA